MEYSYSTKTGITVTLWRDVRKKDPSTSCRLKWCVYFKGRQEYYYAGYKLDADEWETFQNADEKEFTQVTKKAYRLKNMKEDLSEYFEGKLKPAIKDLEDDFSFDALNEKLKVVITNENSVIDAFNRKIEALENDFKVGNAGIYRTTMKALMRFKHYKRLKGANKQDFMDRCIEHKHARVGKDAINVVEDITFDEITPKFLSECENFWRETGTTDATIGLYMRTFRALINRKDDYSEPYLKGKRYPFGDKRYVIPEGGRRSIAIPIQDIWRIEDFESDNYSLVLAKDIFVFMFYANGLNFGDLCRLQYKDIDSSSGEIIFQRKKTLRKGEKPTYIYVPILPPMIEIINRHGNKERDGYIFPFLNGIEPTVKNEKRIKEAINIALNPINSALKTIAAQLELDPNLSTSYTRNSYITHLTSELYVNPIVVKMMVGHSTKKDVTAGYVKLTSKKRREINSQLINPNKKYSTIVFAKML